MSEVPLYTLHPDMRPATDGGAGAGHLALSRPPRHSGPHRYRGTSLIRNTHPHGITIGPWA